MRPAERLRQLLGRPRLLVAGAIVVQWLTCLVVGLRAASVDLGAASLLDVVFLGPLALVCAFRIAAVGGIALGGWTLLVWVVLPWLAPAFTIASYDATLRDQVLPLVLGLTGDAGYAGGVAYLVAVALLQQWGRVGTVLSLLLVAIAGATLLWSAPELSLDALDGNMALLREYFWSQRLLQWVPFAGVIAIGRRSWPLAVQLGGWLAVWVAFRMPSPSASPDGGELFRALLPALPAYVLLVASLPLLVPTLTSRLGPLARPAEAR
ncbi:MAG: hypothetical protein ABIR67_09765 [Gaiellaceae bacterium]